MSRTVGRKNCFRDTVVSIALVVKQRLCASICRLFGNKFTDKAQIKARIADRGISDYGNECISIHHSIGFSTLCNATNSEYIFSVVVRIEAP